MKDNILDEVNTGNSKRFILLITFIILSIIFLITTIIFIILYANAKNESNDESSENTTPEKNDDEPLFPPQERFIKVLSKLTESEGALVKQGKHDILNSTYFNFVDVYNMKSSGSLILLEKFKTYQQTSEITCGPASLIMAINYLDGTVLDEAEVKTLCKTEDEIGTKTYNLESAITAFGYSFDSKNNYTVEDNPTNNTLAFSKYIKESLRNNESIIVASNDWGGHYSVIIGYDDMGTEDYTEDDIIILADPYDTTDHMSDGYTIFSFERFYSQMVVEIFDAPGEKLYFNRIKRKVKN